MKAKFIKLIHSEKPFIEANFLDICIEPCRKILHINGLGPKMYNLPEIRIFTSLEKTYCFAKIGKFYIPPPFLNTGSDGSICMGYHPYINRTLNYQSNLNRNLFEEKELNNTKKKNELAERIVEYFFNSEFNDGSILCLLVIYGIKSIPDFYNSWSERSKSKDFEISEIIHEDAILKFANIITQLENYYQKRQSRSRCDSLQLHYYLKSECEQQNENEK
jgi:hypothetical protein